uniref:ELMO domain-containing protein n=1 Tax=Setaria digitata TaxID=48799 RepID=A0A915PXA7_9BILA
MHVHLFAYGRAIVVCMLNVQHKEPITDRPVMYQKKGKSCMGPDQLGAAHFHTASKPLKEIDIRLPENLVKGAVKLDPHLRKYLGSEYPAESNANVNWAYNEVLTDLITRLSIELKLPQSERNTYALKFEDRDNDGVFLTKENRGLVPQGFILILTASPERYAKNFLSRLHNPSMHDLRTTLTELIALCGDISFATEFMRVGGYVYIFEVFEKGLCADSVSCQSRFLQALLLLMDHPGLMYWSQVPDEFISKVAENITGRAKQEDNTLLVSSLNIVDLILNSKKEEKMNLVFQEVPFESLIRHLEKSDERVILNVLTLMNSLYNKAKDHVKNDIIEHLHVTPFRCAIEKSVLRKGKQLDVGIEQQLVTVQRIQLNKLSQKAMRIPTEAEIERVFQLKIFNGDNNKSMHANIVSEERRAEFLSFTEAVIQTPPGSLALETIVSFVTYHSDSIAKISMENSMRSDKNLWSFLLVSVHLVQMLIDILHVVSEPEEGDRLMVLLFKSDRPFLDLFAVLVKLFHRTWREMHASEEDTKKVLAVVRKQIDVCLLEKPDTIEKLEELLAAHSYPHMKNIWEKERSAKEAEELQSDAVKELREYLRPSIVELILKNRKNVLKNGYKFGKLVKSKSIQKVDIADIQRVVAGGEGDFPMSSTKGKKNSNVRGITLEVGDKPDLYHLITFDEQTINAWCDGINALIGINKLSIQAQRQVDRFLNIELKMRLLELDHIPNSIEIPPLPENFDWIPKNIANGESSITKV